MHITALHLHTSDLAAQQTFYTRTLGLPLVEEAATTFTVQAGQTLLTFQEAEQEGAMYHFAFVIPDNSWEQARAWLTARVVLLTREGQDTFFFDNWNSHSFYFHDPVGNILEFIAHHIEAEAPATSFSIEDIMHLSEIGLVVDDVSETVEQLRSWLGIGPYRGSTSKEFAAVGDRDGLFIVVQKGRPWMPTEHEQAVVAPVHVTIQGTHSQHYRIAQFPYDIVVAPATAISS